MGLLAKATGKKSKARAATRSRDEGAANGTLHIRFSDSGWKASLLSAANNVLWSEAAACYPDSAGDHARSVVAQAIEALENSEFEDQVGSVVLGADDSDLQIIDHRLARLTNFEPRALKEFGAQQVRGRPVAYASVSFGASSAREMERRILCFLPEDTMEAFFYGLGRFATSLTAIVPGAAPYFAPDAGGVFASLRMHGEYSQLVIANAETGIVVVRRLPVGVFTLARVYGAEHGLELEQSVAALRARTRLPPAETVLAGTTLAPEYRTATYLALAPLLTQLRDEIAATMDYFQFERLAGRPAAISLVFSGAPVSGLVRWLADAFAMQVELVEETAVLAPAAGGTLPLNLLEGARPGLLKLGAEPFEFADGRFKPIKPVQTGVAMKAASGLGAQFPILKKLPALSFLASANSIVISREQLMAGVAVCGAAVLVTMGNMSFLSGPAKASLAVGSTNYATAAAQSIESVARKVAEDSGAERPRKNLWAEDLVSVARAIVPNMHVIRLAFSGPPVQPVANFEISGALSSQSSANLKSVADLIDRLEEDKSFRRRFGEILFTGAGEGPLDSPETNFRVTARMAGPPQ